MLRQTLQNFSLNAGEEGTTYEKQVYKVQSHYDIETKGGEGVQWNQLLFYDIVWWW
jgi:hypothetical protein